MLLAHEWLYGEVVKTRYDAELRRHLELPERFNPHSTFIELGKYAERVVFTDDVPSLLYEMNENRQLSLEGIMSTCRLPYDCFWLEYTSRVADGSLTQHKGKLHYGVLVKKLHESIDRARVRMLIVCGSCTNPELERGLYAHGVRFASSIVYVIEFKTWPPIVKTEHGIPNYRFDVEWSFNKNKLRYTEDDKHGFRMTEELNSLCWVVNEITFGIFLITQPKVYDIEHHIPSDKLQRSRKRSGKKPLLEYKKIMLRIGKTSVKHYATRPASGENVRASQDTESAEAVQHRRYHKVMGHFRHYINTDNPRTVWIEPHYRGDPKLGVTFTERDVMR